MLKRALLLDVDGVLVRNKALSRHVAYNCTRFVQKISKQPMDYMEASMKNRLFYKVHGHTLSGVYAHHLGTNLRGATAAKHAPLHLEEHAAFRVDLERYFNDFVYDDGVMNGLADHLDGPEFGANLAGFDMVVAACESSNTPICLFSNAPAPWCHAVAARLVMEFNMPMHKVFSSDSFNTHYKPEPEVYEKVEQVLADKKQLLFVDDSLTNLIPVKGRAKWRPLLFNQRTMSTLATNILEVGVYIHATSIKNPETFGMIIRKCVPNIPEDSIERIFADIAREGKALVTRCPAPLANLYMYYFHEDGIESTLN